MIEKNQKKQNQNETVGKQLGTVGADMLCGKIVVFLHMFAYTWLEKTTTNHTKLAAQNVSPNCPQLFPTVSF